MKINEVQVGDWVNIKNPFGKVEATQIKNIHGENFNLEFKCDEEGLEKNTPGYYIENASPIYLTKLILEKNGFDVRDPSEAKLLMGEGNTTVTNITVKFYRGGMYLLLRVYDHYQRIEIKIQYVHELQHAMKLMGIDKEIEI